MRSFLAAATVLLTVSLAAAPRPRAVVPRNDAPPAVWLVQHAIPLRSTERALDDGDLAPLLPLVAGARVVALGDATHGTHELFTLKQRLVPYLVEQAGFRTVAFEAPYELDKLDAYVKTGSGDPAAALQIDDYFFWDAQEVLDLVLWIRAWNAAGHPPVSIAGIDSVHPLGATDAVVRYLGDVDGTAAFAAFTRYECLNDYWLHNSYLSFPPQSHDQCRAGIVAVRREMEERRADYERATSHDAFEAALHAARVAEESEESFATARLSRDAAMGENIVWHAGRAKTIVIGHQAHFGRLTYDFIDPRGIKPAGAWATDALGSAYVPIASTMYSGSVTILLATGGHYAPIVADIAPPAAGDVAELFSRSAMPALVVPLHYTPAWLAGRQRWRIAGTTTTSIATPAFTIEDNLAAGYDAIIYVERTSATRLLATPRL